MVRVRHKYSKHNIINSWDSISQCVCVNDLSKGRKKIIVMWIVLFLAEDSKWIIVPSLPIKTLVKMILSKGMYLKLIF